MNTLEIEVKRKKIRVNYFLKNRPKFDVDTKDIRDVNTFGPAEYATVHYNPPINDLLNINAFLKEINSGMEVGGIFKGHFVDCNRTVYKSAMYSLSIAERIVGPFEFIVHRVFPKTKVLRKVYFALTKGKNRRLSKAEVLGRLVFSGFEILDTTVADGQTHFTVRKTGEPLTVSNVSEGWIYRMPRVGLNGKMIHVYKFRTMHPYSEFLQDYLKHMNGYASNGKIQNDFRMTRWGKFLRRYWLDEIPQLINVIKGDMKLVGVRPISVSYFNDIPKDMQALRIQHKPGCIPPYVAMNRASSVSSVLNAEREYMETRLQKPYTTDIKYLFWAVYNIIVKKKRSA